MIFIVEVLKKHRTDTAMERNYDFAQDKPFKATAMRRLEDYLNETYTIPSHFYDLGDRARQDISGSTPSGHTFLIEFKQRMFTMSDFKKKYDNQGIIEIHKYNDLISHSAEFTRLWYVWRFLDGWIYVWDINDIDPDNQRSYWTAKTTVGSAVHTNQRKIVITAPPRMVIPPQFQIEKK